MGISSGFVAVLVYVLYLVEGAAALIYGHHRILWFMCPLWFFWLGYIWLIAHRGGMRDDPLVFAFQDRTSRLTLALMVVIAFISA
jgi:hypothetical protein